MTNTKFRKRALLSSVAMLLVALVALGSATFAWFTSNPAANATGIKYSTTTGTGLLAKAATDTNGYSHETGLWGGKQTTLPTFSLQPASLDAAANVDVTVFYTAEADEDDSYESTGTITSHAISAVTDATGTAPTDVYAEKIYLKTTGGTSSTGTLQLSRSQTAYVLLFWIRMISFSVFGALAATHMLMIPAVQLHLPILQQSILLKLPVHM